MSVLRVSRTGPVVLMLALGGCGGSSGNTAAPTYTIGGTVMGLASGGSVDILYGSGSLTVSKNGPFTLPTGVANATSYDITIGASPTGQSCGEVNGAGAIDGADVSNIIVACTDNVSAATLDGTYEIASLEVTSDTDELYTGVPFNGEGTQGSSTVMTNQAGTTFTTATNGGAAYAVTTALALPSLAVGGNNVGAIAGQDGDEFYWLENATNANGVGPGLALGVRPLQTATLASLSGDWITVGLTLAATPYASEGSVTINSDGSFSGSQSTLDVTGAASTQAISGAAGSYAVTDNLVTFAGNSGYVSANGEFAVLTAVTQQPGGVSANYPGLIAAVKQGTGVTLATLSGVYSLGSLSLSTATIGDGETFTLYFDGAGNFNGSASENDNGISDIITWSGTYSVTGTGVLTLTDSSGNVSTGGVSADGNIIVAAALTAGGTEAPRMFAGFKQ
jgi:hypothetical protein